MKRTTFLAHRLDWNTLRTSVLNPTGVNPSSASIECPPEDDRASNARWQELLNTDESRLFLAHLATEAEQRHTAARTLTRNDTEIATTNLSGSIGTGSTSLDDWPAQDD